MKRDEKIYRIPKNLNDDFALLAHYTVGDAAAIVTLFCVATFLAMQLGRTGIYFFPVLYTVLRFKITGFPVHYWARVALGYLLGNSMRCNEYILFEKERLHGTDKPSQL